MILKVILGVFIFLNFSTASQAAENPDVVLWEFIVDSDAKEWDGKIPADTPPGYKSIQVKIFGMGKSEELKKVIFCKDIDGIIQWSNICPGLAALAAQARLENADSRSELPIYEPLNNPKQTTSTALIAFAALGVLAGAGAMTSQGSSRSASSSAADSGSQGYLSELLAGEDQVASTALGRGDKSKLWRKPINQKIDKLVTKIGNRISGFSPLATRILADGNYARSLMGPFSLVIYPFSVALGIFASLSVQQEALPPSLALILAMMVVGVLDALGGYLVSVTFIISVLVGGHATNLNSILTIFGVSLLTFSPVLLAGAFRPFRRRVSDFTSLWERITDYLVASVLTGWIVEQIVFGLPGLAGLELPLTTHARFIALTAAGLVLLRFALEDLSTKLFPLRLATLQPDYRERSNAQNAMTAVVKIGVFGVVAGKFIGISPELFMGLALFALPFVMEFFEERFPKSEKIGKWMPSGIIEMLVMTTIGYVLTIAVQNRYPEAKTYVLTSFVILSVPGFFIETLGFFGKEGAKDWRITKIGKFTYRILGVSALGLLIYIALSGLLVSTRV